MTSNAGLAGAIDALARRFARLEQNQLAASTPQLAYSSIQNGALRAHDDTLGETMQIGLQWDGTYAPTVTNGPTPPTPSNPTVEDATESLVIYWNGSFTGGLLPTPMDFLRVDAHVGSTSDFIPTHDNRVGSFVSPQGGALSVTLPYGTYFVKLVLWTLAGKVSDATDGIEGDSWPVEASTDGFAPDSSPDPEVLSGIQEMYVRWTPIINADPVTYDVHISTALGFTPDSTTKVGETTSSQLTIRKLPGAAPAEGESDPRDLLYDTAYYVRIVARDDDGSAAPSLQAVGSIFQVTGINLAVDSVAAANIVAGTLTGDKFAATVILAGTFKTGEAGQRVEMGVAGIQGYKSDGSLMINFPTDPSQNALIDAEIIARGLTATGSIVMRAGGSLEAGQTLRLKQVGASPPISSPVLANYRATRTPSTLSLAEGDKTGVLGIFDLVPSEVSFIEWKDSELVWILHQVRPNGTRAWFFDYDGNPTDAFSPAAGDYFTDYPNWEVWSVTEVTTSSAPKNGVYRIAKWIPTGEWYIHCPQGGGLNLYTRLNTATAPAIGNNGTDVYIAEVVGTQLNIRYLIPTGVGAAPAPFVIYRSNQGYVSNYSLSTVLFDSDGFDIGSGRYLTGFRGINYNNRLIYSSGTNNDSLHPGGTTAGLTSWTQTTKDAESFEAAHASPRCIAWMETDYRFWTYAGDGNLYQHSDEFWDPSVTPSTVWVQETYQDTDPAGTGLHETTPGPLRSITRQRRADVIAYLGPIPGAGGVDDPNAHGVYAATKATTPTNSEMWLQDSAGTPSTLVTPVFTASSHPPTVNSFLTATVSQVANEDGSAYIKSDGSIKGVSILKGTDSVAIEGPYYYGYLPANVSKAVGNQLLDTWISGDPNETGETGNVGITHASGVFTLPAKAGWYTIDLAIMFAANATGLREAYIYRGSSLGTMTVFSSATPHASTSTTVQIHRKLYFAASATFRVIINQQSGGALNILGDNAAGTAGRYSYINIEYDRP